METNNVKDLLTKHAIERLDRNVMYFNIGIMCGRIMQCLEDNPKLKEKILEMLKDEGAS